MRIRTKLTLIFFSIVTVILTCVSLSIYFFSADYREQDFYKRLRSKAENSAQILFDVDEIDNTLLRRIERDNPSNLPNERITIYNSENEELYNTDVNDVVPDNVELLNKIRSEEEIRYMYNDFEIIGFVYHGHRNDKIVIVAAATDINGFTKLKNLRKILIIVFGASLVLVSILGWFYAGRVLAPISTIVADVDSITAAKMNLRLDEGNKTDELSKLSQTFNKMLDRLEVAFRVQQNFIANASHELRTPITAIVGEIDVTLLQPRSPDKYIQVLHSISEEIVNLNILSNQLLLLAQASTDSPQQRFAPVRVDEVLWQAKEDLKKAHGEYIIQIELDMMLNDESLIINGDEQLIKAAFTNLMDNACKYADDLKAIIRLNAIDSNVTIQFINHGMGIPVQSVNSIFDAFYRGENTKEIKGHGIGLSLVKRIVHLHKGFVKVDSQPGELTTFTVSIPGIVESPLSKGVRFS